MRRSTAEVRSDEEEKRRNQGEWTPTPPVAIAIMPEFSPLAEKFLRFPFSLIKLGSSRYAE
jgi:hypothetical protein